MEILGWIVLFCVMAGVFIIPILFVGRMVSLMFSREGREQIRKRWWFYALWCLTSVFLVFGLLFPGGGNLAAARRAITANRIDQLQTGIVSYQTEYELPIPGANNADIVKELEGENPRRIAFLNLRSSDKNAKGEILDAWGTPLRVTMTDPQHPLIQSAGPDRKWNTPDDIDNAKN
jgi:hypothetical protein